MATSFTEAQLAAIEAAYATGATEYTYEGRRVVYRSLDEMERVISTMRSALNEPTTKRINRVYLSTRRGF